MFPSAAKSSNQYTINNTYNIEWVKKLQCKVQTCFIFYHFIKSSILLEIELQFSNTVCLTLSLGPVWNWYPSPLGNCILNIERCSIFQAKRHFHLDNKQTWTNLWKEMSPKPRYCTLTEPRFEVNRIVWTAGELDRTRITDFFKKITAKCAGNYLFMKWPAEQWGRRVACDLLNECYRAKTRNEMAISNTKKSQLLAFEFFADTLE